MLGGIGGRRRRGRQRMRWLDGITDSMDVSLMNSGIWWWTGRPGMLRFLGSQRVRPDWATELNWTECIYMEFRKMVTITLYERQQKRHRYIEQSYGLFGRGRGWDDLGEWHWNMYNIICEMNRQSRFDAWYRMLGAGALGWPRGMVWGGVHTCTPVADSCWCMAKPIQYCKVISLQLK